MMPFAPSRSCPRHAVTKTANRRVITDSRTLATHNHFLASDLLTHHRGTFDTLTVDERNRLTGVSVVVTRTHSRNWLWMPGKFCLGASCGSKCRRTVGESAGFCCAKYPCQTYQMALSTANFDSSRDDHRVSAGGIKDSSSSPLRSLSGI